MVNSPEISLLSKIANYTEILAKDPYSTAFVSLSDIYRQMGLLEDALEVAEKGVKAVPRFCPGYVILGRIQYERGNMSAAALAFESAYALDNENLPAIKGLARVLVQQRKFVRVRQLLGNAASLAPEDATVQKMLKALPPIAAAPTAGGKSSIKNEDKEPIATSTIAEIYLKQGLPQRALKVYIDLQKKHPENDALTRKVDEILNLLLELENTAKRPSMPIESLSSSTKLPKKNEFSPREKLEELLAAVCRRKQNVLQ